MGRAATGTVRKMKSGRWQARFQYPDGTRRPAPTTFTTKRDANAWLAQQHADVSRGQWTPATGNAVVATTFREYAGTWLKNRKVKGRPLAPRTRDGYRDLLGRFINPTFGHLPIHTISRDQVEKWYDHTLPADHPTYRAKAYSLLRTILTSAVEDGHLADNPARVRGGGSSQRRKRIRPATLDELDTITASMPDKYALLIQLAAWTGLRFGELTELRRGDVDTKDGILRVRRGVVLVKPEEVTANLSSDTRECGCRPGCIVGPPKTEAGERDVTIPPHLLPLVRQHLLKHTAPGPKGLLFPARSEPDQHLRQSSLAKVYYPARKAAGREDLRFHDLRHTGATMAAQTGATLKELMSRLGHATPQAAMIYQHAAADRDALIAQKLSAMTGWSPDADAAT